MPIATNPQTGETVYLTPDGQWAKAQTAVNPQTKETLAFDGSEWKPVPQQSKGVLGFVADAGRSVAHGATFGFADEISARMDALIGNGTYEENIQRERARDKQIPAAIAIPGEIAGAVGTAYLASRAAPAVATAAAARYLPQAARYILGGAGSGALFGAGSAEEGNRTSGAAKGAGIGAVGGYLAPKVVNAASGLASGIRNALSPASGAAADISRAALRDNTTPQALAQNLRTAQAAIPEATLADIGGENVRGLVERVAQTPGAGRTIVVPQLEARQQQQMNRIGADLAALTRSHRTATQAVEQTMAERATAARPLYDEAMNFNARAVPEIVSEWQNVTATGWGQSILNSANLRRTLQTEYGIRNPADAPMMVLIDAWKKEVDGVVGEAVRAGNSRKAQVLSQMRDRVVGVVDQANPAYLSARNAWAGPSQYIEAIEQGRNILARNVSAEELTTQIGRMSEAQLEAFRIGAVSAIRSRMGSDPARLADMTKYLRAPEMRAKVAAILPDDTARQNWQSRLDFEVGSSALTGRALGNSATYRRQAERQDADNLVMDLVSDAFKTSTGTESLFAFILNQGRNVARSARDTLRSRSDNLLADALVNPNASGLDRLLQSAAARQAPPSPLRNPAAINAANAMAQ